MRGLLLSILLCASSCAHGAYAESSAPPSALALAVKPVKLEREQRFPTDGPQYAARTPDFAKPKVQIGAGDEPAGEPERRRHSFERSGKAWITYTVPLRN